MGSKLISARLRPKKDDDIKIALSKLPAYYDESDIVREALRQFLFSHKGRAPQLLGSQVYEESATGIDDEDTITLEKVDSIDGELDLEANLNKFITE